VTDHGVWISVWIGLLCWHFVSLAVLFDKVLSYASSRVWWVAMVTRGRDRWLKSKACFYRPRQVRVVSERYEFLRIQSKFLNNIVLELIKCMSV
jgi:hypothetical protein